MTWSISSWTACCSALGSRHSPDGRAGASDASQDRHHPGDDQVRAHGLRAAVRADLDAGGRKWTAGWRVVGWILVAMVGARSAAMAFNRIADARIDAANPRTQSPRDSQGHGVDRRGVAVGDCVARRCWLLAAYMLNPLAFALSPVALAGRPGLLVFEAIHEPVASVAGAVPGDRAGGRVDRGDGQDRVAPMVLSAAVMLWTAGFDVIYSLQDLEFDRKTGLFSLPARIGPARALLVSRAFHAVHGRAAGVVRRG